jgi:hypothetical protein
MAAPKVVKEITSGSSATLALDAAGGANSSSSLRFQRSWKIVYENPSDVVDDDVRSRIGVTVGQANPLNPFCACDSIDIKPDGESRHAFIVTATYTSRALSLQQGGYETGAGGNADPRTQPPEARKANWSTDTSTIEAPSWHWKPIAPPQAPGLGQWGLAKNPVGDMYDGVMTMQPIVTIKVEQTQANDPNIFAMYVGQVNTNAFRIGALQCGERSVMLKGISATPHAEIVGNRRWRGWKANYEFVYKPGFNSYLNAFLGWDVAIPVSGFNVKNVAGATADATVEKGALALKLTDLGTIDPNLANAVIQPTLVNENSRAAVLISAPGAKDAQRPSAQPVALNWNGTPRKLSLMPHVQRCQVFADFNMALLNLRLD